MKTSTFTPSFAACSLVSGLLWCACVNFAGAAAADNSRGGLATDPRLDMVTALKALGPHPSLGGQAKVFGRFVGTWDGEYIEFSKDGRTSHSSGQWIFGWVMDGRAVQDLFIIQPSAAHQGGFVGTTLRYFDPKSQSWSDLCRPGESGSRDTGGRRARRRSDRAAQSRRRGQAASVVVQRYTRRFLGLSRRGEPRRRQDVAAA